MKLRFSQFWNIFCCAAVLWMGSVAVSRADEMSLMLDSVERSMQATSLPPSLDRQDVIVADLDKFERVIKAPVAVQKGTAKPDQLPAVEKSAAGAKPAESPSQRPVVEPMPKKNALKGTAPESGQVLEPGKFQTEGQTEVEESLDRWEFIGDVSTSFRSDELNWNIAGTLEGTSPNIISELQWTDLRILQLQGSAKVIYDNRWRLEGMVDYGWILQGDNQDSDYASDNRTDEFSRSNNASNGDNVFDGQVGAGYQFMFESFPEIFMVDRAWLTFLAGWSYHEQNLRMTDGYQTIPATGPFDGLDSTYQAEWNGPWGGLELICRRGPWMSFLRYELHWADYFAQADWNLRTDFAHPVSYEHEADGLGHVFSLGFGYVINDAWSTYVKGNYQDWETDAGMDQTFFSDGSTSFTRLNEVNWQSYGITLGATYRFSR